MNAPRLARLLIRLTAPRDRRDDALGDLEEAHRSRRLRGAARAWLASMSEAVVIALAFLGTRLRRRHRAPRGPIVSLSDVRLAARLLGRQPFLAATAIVALTVGIGLANIGFAAMEALLFSRLPYANGDRFVKLTSVTPLERAPAALTAGSYPRLLQVGALEHVGVVTGGREHVTLASGVIEQVTVAGITPTSFAYLPAVPLRGRPFGPADARDAVVLVSEAFWRRSLAASDSAIGAALTIDGTQHTIVGVMPGSFEFPNTPAVWLPLSEGFRDGRAEPPDGARLFGVMAPGVTLDALALQLASVGPQLEATGLRSAAAIDATAFTDLGPMAPTLSAVIVIMVLTVLVVIAANVGNLVLARSFARLREFALRAALGASRGRLAAQVMTEVLLLGVIAAVLGTIAAHAVLQRLNQMPELPFWIDFTGGALSMALVAAATLAAAAIAGAWPAMRATRRDLLAGLQGGGGRTSDVRFGRLSGAMLIVQITVSVVMLHGALIVAQGFRQYSAGSIDLPRNVLTMGLVTGGDGSLDVAQAERVARAVPGVTTVGTTTALPRHSPAPRLVEVEPVSGERPQPARLAPSAAVSAGYFDALGTTAVLGRLLLDADAVPGAHAVAVVNEPFARERFGRSSPLGRRIRLAGGAAPPGPWREIVGVVPDIGLSVGDPSLAAGFYVPLPPDADPVFLTLRVQGEPMTHAEPLREALRDWRPALVAYTPSALEDVAAEDRAFFGAMSAALLGLGAITLVLALAGVYAMMSLIVSRRTREIGIRVALGATATRVVGAIAGRAAMQLAAGGVIGAVLAVLSLRGRDALVSRLGDGGPWTLPFVIATLGLAGLAATWVPLRRALRVRPQGALKAD
jgi:putative ABC transport system permease protein